MGPVKTLTPDESVSMSDHGVQRYEPDDSVEDITKGWSFFPVVKQKIPRVDIANVTKLAVSVGASESRRFCWHA